MTDGPSRAPQRGLARWMEAYVDGDPAAFRKLHRALAPRLAGFVAGLVKDPSAVDDIVQVTFLKAHVARERFSARSEAADGAVQAWYFTIARHAALDYLRSRQRAHRRTAPVDAAALAAGDGGNPGAAGNPEDATMEDERRAADIDEVRRAVEALPPGQRVVVEMHKIQGLPMKEIARRLGIREGAVRVRAHRAYRALAKALGVEEA